MASCPQCGAEINADFGMVSCHSCQAVIFFDMDGNPQIASAQTEEQIDENIVEQVETQIEDQPEIQHLSSEFQSVEPGLDLGLEETADLQVSEATHDIEKIVRSSNSVSAYELIISGIDTAELREKILEELSDSKYAFDVSQLETQINVGILHFTNISSVKAAVLVRRLSSYPFEFAWRQVEDEKI